MQLLKLTLAILILGAGEVCFADTIAGPAGTYISRIQNEGSTVTRRNTLNFTGAGIDCVDNAGQKRTDCTVTAGGGGGMSPGATYYIQNTNTLQTGATFYVSSGTVNGQFNINGSTAPGGRPLSLINETYTSAVGNSPLFRSYLFTTPFFDNEYSVGYSTYVLSGVTRPKSRIQFGTDYVLLTATTTADGLSVNDDLIYTTLPFEFDDELRDGDGLAGTSGQVLTSQGAGTYPTWQNAASGSGGGYNLQPATVTIQANQGITGTYGAFSSSVTASRIYANTLMRVATLSSALGGVTPRFAAVGPDANILLAISTGTLGSGSGAGIQAWAWDTPTAADQRLGFYTFGSAYGGGTASNGAGIFGFSGNAWSAGVTQPTYLRAEVTPDGTTTRIVAQHWEKSGQSVFNKNGSVSVSTTIVRVAGSSGQSAPLQTWESVYGTTRSSMSAAGVLFASNTIVSPHVYAASWNGSNESPTKNDVYDKIETLGGGFSLYPTTSTIFVPFGANVSTLTIRGQIVVSTTAATLGTGCGGDWSISGSYVGIITLGNSAGTSCVVNLPGSFTNNVVPVLSASSATIAPLVTATGTNSFTIGLALVPGGFIYYHVMGYE